MTAVVTIDSVFAGEGVMVVQTEVGERMLSAALELIETSGWRSVSLHEIAEKAEVSLADAYSTFPTKLHVLIGLFSRTDRQVLTAGGTEEGESARDRLFEVLMRRFDALAPHRKAVAAVLQDVPYDPLAALVTVPQFANSMAWMLEAARLSSAGFRGVLRTQVVAIIYLNALRVWLRDDSPDMTRTMARLDRDLRRAEKLARWCGPPQPDRSRSGVPSSGAGDAASPGEATTGI